MVGESALGGMTAITNGLHRLSTILTRPTHCPVATAYSKYGTAGIRRLKMSREWSSLEYIVLNILHNEGLSKGLTILVPYSAVTRGDYVSVCLDA